MIAGRSAASAMMPRWTKKGNSAKRALMRRLELRLNRYRSVTGKENSHEEF